MSTLSPFLHVDDPRKKMQTSFAKKISFWNSETVKHFEFESECET
jgi:hypothetical protein